MKNKRIAIEKMDTAQIKREIYSAVPPLRRKALQAELKKRLAIKPAGLDRVEPGLLDARKEQLAATIPADPFADVLERVGKEIDPTEDEPSPPSPAEEFGGVESAGGGAGGSWETTASESTSSGSSE